MSSIAEQRLRVGDDLRAHAYGLHPHWPTARMRREDLEDHLRWVAIMEKLRGLAR